MNSLTSYEQIIAQKLEQLPPLQGLQELVWQRVTDELDNNPSNEDPSPTSPEAPKGGIGRLLIPGIIILILLAWFLYKQLATSTQAEAGKPPASQSEAPSALPGTSGTLPGQDAGKPLLQNDARSAATQPTDSANNDSQPVLTISDTGDATHSAPDVVVPPPLTIPTAAPDSAPKQVANVSADTTKKPPGRKPPGVRGINSSDYKIVPKKDSVP